VHPHFVGLKEGGSCRISECGRCLTTSGVKTDDGGLVRMVFLKSILKVLVGEGKVGGNGVESGEGGRFFCVFWEFFCVVCVG
jgi:hypothetical protein